eukprot:gnl/Dysnectes_brevis/2027_a2337_1772.p1 GENE.gnl/Dysnectes_brevis/2027_a2337_1772~~gnl/Dysnectes_brevis/2027_a2337_1772.p1  ORF type:complete len:191 (-),score=1.89 gnl/Dysnectes_brevis/2027_a2337_1772:31-540(-)
MAKKSHNHYIAINHVAVTLTKRLRIGNLYDLKQLRKIAMKVFAQIVSDANTDFEHLVFLDEYRRIVLPEREATTPFTPMDTSSYDDVFTRTMQISAKLTDVEEEEKAAIKGAIENPKLKEMRLSLHTSLLQLCRLATLHRTDRLTMVRNLIADLERYGQLKGLIEDDSK